MSDISSFTGKFRSHKVGSQDLSDSRVTKRTRESLACNQCRRSKLRCNRGQPCSSCVKRDEATFCNYQRLAEPRLDVNSRTVAEERLLHLESMVRDLMQNQAARQLSSDVTTVKAAAAQVPPHDSAASLDQARPEQIDATRYTGSTHWSAILDDIQELKVVLGGSVEGQEADTTPSGVRALASELIFGSSRDHDIQQIISQYLPPKIEVDRFLSIYFQGESFIIPFVHTYHFQRQYGEFWTDTASVNPLWLSMLFSISYMASLIGGANGPHQSSQNDMVTGRSMLHAAAGQCLVLGEYHRPQTFAVEALAMYGHCKNLRSLDPSREAGAILGMVVRMAYEMGYHRDPNSFGSFNTFEGEMRRRCWAAIKQMDLMISFQLGLPSNICLENCDTKPPRNLLDSDFDADTQVLPESRSENETTKLLWFIVKDRLMITFSKVCQKALSFKEKTEAEITQIDEKLRKMHRTIPDVLRSRPLSESIADTPFLIMTRLYVDFIYLKSVCVLHRKHMARGSIFSTRSCVEAGKRLVSQFIDMYKEFSLGGQLYAERWMLTNFTMNDFLLGTMVLCLVVHTRWKRGSQSSAIDTTTESEVLALLEQSRAICVEKSTISRDARRVSHAIRLTLNGARSSKVLKNTASLPPLSSLASSSDMQSEVYTAQGVDSASQPWSDSIQYDEATFGLLDPFNYMGNDIENIDWTMLDAQNLGQDAPFMEVDDHDE
jgi:hypothetical protein